jgi:hypothetical protein
MSEIVTFRKHEYRKVGGELHRRPVERDGLTPWDAAWLVLARWSEDYRLVPGEVLNFFTQVQNPAAVL